MLYIYIYMPFMHLHGAFGKELHDMGFSSDAGRSAGGLVESSLQGLGFRVEGLFRGLGPLFYILLGFR